MDLFLSGMDRNVSVTGAHWGAAGAVYTSHAGNHQESAIVTLLGNSLPAARGNM